MKLESIAKTAWMLNVPPKYRVYHRYFVNLGREESHWRPDVVSPKGAIGLYQVMPKTAREYGYAPEQMKDVYHNINAAVQHFCWLLKFSESSHRRINPASALDAVEVAVMAYNAGQRIYMLSSGGKKQAGYFLLKRRLSMTGDNVQQILFERGDYEPAHHLSKIRRD